MSEMLHLTKVLVAMRRSALLIESFDGSEPASFMDECFASLHEFSQMLSGHAWQQDARDLFFRSTPVLDRSLIHRRMRHKPLGYAGDYLLIDWMYTCKTAKDRLGRVWDTLAHQYPGVQAVRNRKQYFADLLRHCVAERNPAPLSLLNLGCGSARDLRDALIALDPSSDVIRERVVQVHCVDHELLAIRYAKRLFGEMGLRLGVHWDCTNALRLRPEQKYDLIWSAGLFDYLNDDVSRLLIRRMWRRLNDGGRIVFGNFHPRNPTRVPMELCGGWYLLHRTEEDLIRIASAAGVPIGCITVEEEPLGINLFCHLRKE
jgi:SAM-dependent methyltransferase